MTGSGNWSLTGGTERCDSKLVFYSGETLFFRRTPLAIRRDGFMEGSKKRTIECALLLRSFLPRKRCHSRCRSNWQRTCTREATTMCYKFIKNHVSYREIWILQAKCWAIQAKTHCLTRIIGSLAIAGVAQRRDKVLILQTNQTTVWFYFASRPFPFQFNTHVG